MSYSVKNYKSHEEIKTVISEFLSDYITYKTDSTVGSTSNGMPHRYKFSINQGGFDDLIFFIPEASAANNTSLYFGVSFYDTITDTAKFVLLMAFPNKNHLYLQTNGMDIYTISNGVSKFIAFDTIKSGILFDTWTSLDGQTTKPVIITHLPRCGGGTASNQAYGMTAATLDSPKVILTSETSNKCNIIPLHDVSLSTVTPNGSLCTSWLESKISDSNPINTGGGSCGFSSGYYITPFTLGGYKSSSLYVVDGGASIPPYGLIQLGKYTYIRITCNIFMRVGDD